LLYELLELKEDKCDLIEHGISFYNNLMVKSDQELIDGNLSREKVIKSKLRLEKKGNLKSPFTPLHG